MGSDPQLHDDVSQTAAQATGHGLGPPTQLLEQLQWQMGTDWTSQAGGCARYEKGQ